MSRGRERGGERERESVTVFPVFIGDNRVDIHLHRKQGTIGGRGPSRVPLQGGDRGEWSDVRPRKRKAQAQVDRQRDRLREEQRHRGSWE